MSFEPLRFDRIIELNGYSVFEWAFQDNANAAMDLTDYEFVFTLHKGEDLLFSRTVGNGITVEDATEFTEFGTSKSLGTATPIRALISAADKAALSADQKAGPWISKLRYTPPGGIELVHDWGECTVLQTEVPTA